MSEFFEIAYAAASKRLCLFTGTGFSKAITLNQAPSWQELLEQVCDLTPNPVVLKQALFPHDVARALSLEEAAQVIELELQKVNRNIHNEIAMIISRLVPAGDNSVIQNFLSSNSLEVITTNYDTMLERLCGVFGVYTLTPGHPIPRSDSRVRVYHVHGSINSPPNMVVTSEDYFKFINAESYFSRKLSTVLHENTVVILGYSLGDANLKSIINEYKGFSRKHVIASNIFFVSRSRVAQHIKDYYFHCYGVRVLDGITVHEFFQNLNNFMPVVTPCIQTSLQNLGQAYQGMEYSADYLRSPNSFYEIVCSFSAGGVSISDQVVVRCLGRIIETKIALTAENQAWHQYTHLANWLVYLGTILEIKGTAIEDVYLSAVRTSMSSMSATWLMGRSWDAFRCWESRWGNVIYSNRLMIKQNIETNYLIGDAHRIINMQL